MVSHLVSSLRRQRVGMRGETRRGFSLKGFCQAASSFIELDTYAHLWKLLWLCPHIQRLTLSSVYIIVCRQIVSLTSINVWQHCAESGSVSDYESIAMGRGGCDKLLSDLLTSEIRSRVDKPLATRRHVGKLAAERTHVEALLINLVNKCPL